MELSGPFFLSLIDSDHAGPKGEDVSYAPPLVQTHHPGSDYLIRYLSGYAGRYVGNSSPVILKSFLLLRFAIADGDVEGEI